jgi:gliding motility-associated-like protein
VGGNLLDNDTDAEGDKQSIDPATIKSAEGTLVINKDGSYVFTPAPGYSGPVNYTYKICDNGVPPACAKATLYLLVNKIVITAADTSFCAGGVATLKANVSNLTAAIYKWYADSSLQNLLYTGQQYTTPAIATTTKYYVAVFGNGNLLTPAGYAKEITVTIYPAAPKPSITAGGSLDVCPGGSVKISATASSSYQWFKDGVLITGATAGDYVASAAGIYSVRTTNSFGCSGPESDGLVVRLAPVPAAPVVIADKSTFCVGDTATLTSSVTLLNQWYRDGILITGATTSTLKVTVAGIYTTIVKNNFGCESGSSNAVPVVVNILPPRPVISADGDLKICKDDIRVLSVAVPSGGSAQWYKNGVAMAAATNGSISVSETANFSVIVKNSTGCSSPASASVFVEVVCTNGIYLPNTFTPNGDGMNDVLKPMVPGMAKFQCFRIYNRWGNMIFESLTPNKGWDGTYRGALQPNETYIWIVQGEDKKGKPMKATGTTTLVR